MLVSNGDDESLKSPLNMHSHDSGVWQRNASSAQVESRKHEMILPMMLGPYRDRHSNFARASDVKSPRFDGTAIIAEGRMVWPSSSFYSAMY